MAHAGCRRLLGTVHIAEEREGRRQAAGGRHLPGAADGRRTQSPASGQSPDAERYVEFVKGGKVVGREVVTIVSAAEIRHDRQGHAAARERRRASRR